MDRFSVDVDALAAHNRQRQDPLPFGTASDGVADLIWLAEPGHTATALAHLADRLAMELRRLRERIDEIAGSTSRAASSYATTETTLLERMTSLPPPR